jgi:hypothetical protein
VCDLETSRIGAPYIYDISNLRVKIPQTAKIGCANVRTYRKNEVRGNRSVQNMILKNILTSWRRVLEKLTGSQLVKKFPAIYGTRRFITAYTTACHLSLS